MNAQVICRVCTGVSICMWRRRGGSEPPPPPPDPTAIEVFTQSIQNLTLTDFYQVSFGGLLSRSPETLVVTALDDVYPQTLASLNGWSQ